MADSKWIELRGKYKRFFQADAFGVVEQWYNRTATREDQRLFKTLVQQVLQASTNTSLRTPPSDTVQTELLLLYGSDLFHPNMAGTIAKWLYNVPSENRNCFRDLFNAVDAEKKFQGTRKDLAMLKAPGLGRTAAPGFATKIGRSDESSVDGGSDFSKWSEFDYVRPTHQPIAAQRPQRMAATKPAFADDNDSVISLATTQMSSLRVCAPTAKQMRVKGPSTRPASAPLLPPRMRADTPAAAPSRDRLGMSATEHQFMPPEAATSTPPTGPKLEARLALNRPDSAMLMRSAHFSPPSTPPSGAQHKPPLPLPRTPDAPSKGAPTRQILERAEPSNSVQSKPSLGGPAERSINNTTMLDDNDDDGCESTFNIAESILPEHSTGPHRDTSPGKKGAKQRSALNLTTYGFFHTAVASASGTTINNKFEHKKIEQMNAIYNTNGQPWGVVGEGHIGSALDTTYTESYDQSRRRQNIRQHKKMMKERIHRIEFAQQEQAKQTEARMKKKQLTDDAVRKYGRLIQRQPRLGKLGMGKHYQLGKYMYPHTDGADD
eukprot:NODE_1090_length_1900_cov_103.720315_g1037_i0.p1 GENE.NODE_1090_length_1900_cov_103.720315_g1037_i0~~NODE_1090_length_1900_cov_103.720315_g1037_i0.p1  ORF type:complete len:548 (-),score=93.83 NODE_1090_length_1900_cov_103.720315_g1037_i0:177-1820(-)